MRYSLFVDESGDFKKSKEWIVSGLLCPYDKNLAEANLKKTLGNIPKRSEISSKKKFHLTELRRERGHGAAIEVAESLFDALQNSQHKWKLVVGRNHTKFGLSDSERTYRLMLLDLIALAESTVPDNVRLSGFDIVIATRTNKDSGGKMTTMLDLNQDVVSRITDALEAGIASRGMIEFLDSKGLDITLMQANKSWGLIVADFISNISYNHKYTPDSALLDKLKRAKILREFQSFGGYEERRACIAERDGNFIDAIRRWAYIEYKSTEKEKRQSEILVRLFNKIISFGTAGPRSTLDAIIEHIWRDESLRSNLHKIYNVSERLEMALTTIIQTCESTKSIPLLFRLHNFMHLVANKIGDTQKAQQLIEKQKQLKSLIALSPEYFHLILDSQLYEIDTVENSLCLSKSLGLATSNHSIIQQYKECWDLLVEDQSSQGFNCSRINIKAEMTLLRSQILSGLPNELSSAFERISNLKEIVLDPMDKKRLLNYEILAYAKSKNFSKSIDIGIVTLQSEPDEFAVQHILGAVVSALLIDREKFYDYGTRLLEFMNLYHMPDKGGHPVDLIWRDFGLLDFLISNNKTVALKYLKRNKKHLSLIPDKTPIAQWLRSLSDIHVDYVKGKNTSIENIKKIQKLISLPNIDIWSKINHPPYTQRDLLSLFRHVSPYWHWFSLIGVIFHYKSGYYDI